MTLRNAKWLQFSKHGGKIDQISPTLPVDLNPRRFKSQTVRQKLADFPMAFRVIGSVDSSNVGGKMSYVINFKTVFSENQKVLAIIFCIFYRFAAC